MCMFGVNAETVPVKTWCSNNARLVAQPEMGKGNANGQVTLRLEGSVLGIGRARGSGSGRVSPLPSPLSCGAFFKREQLRAVATVPCREESFHTTDKQGFHCFCNKEPECDVADYHEQGQEPEG